MARKDLSRPVSDYAIPIDVTLSVDFTIQEALDFLRHKNLSERIVYFYVVDADKRLCGVINTRSMLLRDPSTPVHEIMQTKVICLQPDRTLQDAMEVMEAHKLLALPVIDTEKHLIGVIDVDLYLEESIDVAISRRRSDIFQFIGVYLEEERHPSPFKSYLARMPWIFCNLGGGIICAMIAHLNEIVLAKVILLAMFIPLVLTLSESISMQSMTQSLQLLRSGKIRWRSILSRILKETKTVTMIATTCGLIVGSISVLWGDGYMPGVAICLGIFVSVIVTATIGSFTPVILHLRKRDPKVASGPVVLMFADTITTAIYLYLSSALLL
ncbi:MAG: CBS domain-containing protein [Simkaniaceae bacterium]|nr:CBS domain-containing protein [Simkaniaceae bacterium]